MKEFSSKCDQICSFLQIWSHILKKSLMENFIFCAVMLVTSNALHLSVGDPIKFSFFIQVLRVLIGSRIKSNYHSEVAQNEFYP